MKLIIEIPEELAKKQWYTDKEIWTVIRTVWNGTQLDDIRAEIEQERVGYPPSADAYKTINKVLQIIDRYTT